MDLRVDEHVQYESQLIEDHAIQTYATNRFRTFDAIGVFELFLR